MDWYHIASALVNLPSLLAFLMLFGLVAHIKKPWLGGVTLGISTTLFIAACLPMSAHRLAKSLETYAPLRVHTVDPALLRAPTAIVVLGGGRYSDAPEYRNDTVGRFALERLRYAAFLHRQTGAPILLTAGSVHGEGAPEADLMHTALTRDFKVPVKWTEGESRTTLENADKSLVILRAAGIKHIYLVTHAIHMRRSLLAFDNAGIRVTPAPIGFSTLAPQERRIFGYLPSALAFSKSSAAIHEHIGYWWYQFKIDRRVKDTDTKK